MKKPKYKWNKETIQALLDTNDQAVYNGLIQIYHLQTSSEKASYTTHLHNSVGFSGPDAAIMTSFAEFYLRHKKLYPKQMAIARKKIKRYWKQLMHIALQNGKNPVVA